MSGIAVVTFLALSITRVLASGWNRDTMDPYYNSNRVLTVTTILIEPYAMLKPTNDTSSGRAGRNLYMGYMVDLMDHLADLVGFKYRMVPVWDGQFGYREPDGVWNGMIGELLRQEADIAAGPMFLTRQREQVVGFTSEFMSVRASILLAKRLDGSVPEITSVENLLQSRMKVGTLNRGIIHRALKISNNTLYKLLYEHMLTNEKQSFTTTNEEGIARVRQGNYAFILPDKIAEYISRRRPCDLVVVDNFLIHKGFGLALPKGSALLTYLSRAIDQLHDQRILHDLYRKWWIERGECGQVEPRGPVKVRRLSNHSGRVSSSAAGAPSSELFCKCITVFVSIAAWLAMTMTT